MERDLRLGHMKTRLMLWLFTLAICISTSLPAYAGPQYNFTCSSCHDMPPLDSASRDITTGAFKGNHQTHQPAAAQPANCVICHNSTGFTTSHLDGGISFPSNINSSPATGQYKVGGVTVSFKNQTSVPVLGSCTNVNCHLEKATPVWGSANFTYTNTTSNDCDQCHGAPPAGTTDAPGAAGSHGKHDMYYTGAAQCRKCHADHPAEANKFAHATSAGNRDLIIQLKDPQDVAGGTYSGPLNDYLPSQTNAFGGCTNLYCHSDGQATPTYKTVTWGASLPADCTGCHGNATSNTLSGKHQQHLNPAVNTSLGLGNGLGCVDCHAKTVSNNTTVSDKTRHVNKYIDYSSTHGGGSAKYSTATKQCTNSYCHSNGNPAAPVFVSMTGSKTWNGVASFGCNGCHGRSSAIGAPDYANGGPVPSVTANSHGKHVAGASGTTVCSDCHIKTASMTAAGRFKDYSAASYHLNGTPNVYFNTAKAGAAAWTQGTGQCSNVTCHGGNTVTWGATLNCQDCHGGAVDAESFSPLTGTQFWNDGAATKINTSTEWGATGHGKASGTYSGSGNPAAGFTVANACEYCHEPSVGHHDNTNPFRLRNQNDATWGKNGVCMSCHSATAPGVTVGGVLKKRTTSKAIGSYHYGAKHAANGGGRYCWDCHDGHGDSNSFMVHAQVAKTSETTIGAPTTFVIPSFVLTATPVWGDYVKTPANNGICQVCHTNTNYFTATLYTAGHNAGIRCTSCHTHTGATISTAFPGSESSGGAPCLGCHNTGFTNMQSNASYHHYMQNDAATYSNTATPTVNDTNRRCMMCHVDHDIFRPDLNANGARAKNLRTGATDAVSSTAGFVNNDFDNSLTSGGICVSCHTNQQTKNAVSRKSDGTTVTPLVTKADYGAAAHNYATTSAAYSDTSRMNANCVKCHNAQNGETSPKTNFGNHDSTTRSLMGALGGTLADPYEAPLCYRCHSKAADAIGGTKKTADANDWYGAVTNMSDHSTDIYQVFQKANKHQVDLAAYSGKHKPTLADESRTYISNAANKHIECGDCHNSHAATAANPTKGAMGVNPTNSASNWTAPTGYAEMSVAGGDDEYRICFRCHSGYNTGLASWNSAWTNIGKEFSTNNKSYHWVEGDRGAAKADTTYGNFNATYVGKMMPRYNGSTNAVLRGVKMRCSDCHGSDNAENNPNGPHGSAYAKMLKVPAGSPYTTWNSTVSINNRGTVWCFNCHDPNFTNSGFRGPDGELHVGKHNKSEAKCMSCHIKIPHGWQIPHLLKPYNMPTNYPADNAAYNGTGSSSGIDLPLNSTNWNLSGSWTENSCGSHQRCN
ncbi:MAG: cytochrome [Geobacteraceae bacterium]|nr:MAG: cytochrome [Geobacteraceae bacterium]